MTYGNVYLGASTNVLQVQVSTKGQLMLVPDRSALHSGLHRDSTFMHFCSMQCTSDGS